MQLTQPSVACQQPINQRKGDHHLLNFQQTSHNDSIFLYAIYHHQEVKNPPNLFLEYPAFVSRV